MTFEEYQEMKRKMREAKEEAAKAVTVVFKEGAKQLFEKHPDLQSFGWKQYTPYFNDGDECVFGVNTDYPRVNDLDEDCDGEDWEKYKASTKPVAKFLSNFDDEDFKAMFGDHVSVTVSRDGEIEIEEYCHD